MNNEEKNKKQERKPYQKKRVIVPTIISVSLVLLGIYSFIHALSYQSTDDAFVDGHMVTIAPKVSGQVITLNVKDNEFVHEGQLLVEIDPRDYQNKVHELEGALREAQANKNVTIQDTERNQADLSETNKNLEFATKDFNRYKKLRKEGLCTKQQYDLAETKYKEAIDKEHAMTSAVKSFVAKQDASSANIEKLQAQLAQAKLNLSYTKIYAPQSGNVSSRSVEKGNYIQIGQSLMSIVSPNIWVTANYKETQVTHMQPGQPVDIKVDTYPGKTFKGKIDSLQKASGAKSSLFPPENAVGSYIKVVQRIPVKILFDEDITNYNIAPGMSVVPRVKIK